MYDIIAAWHDHAADVEEYVALQEEYGMDAQGIRDALQEAQQAKKDAADYEALRRDLGTDADGMRKVLPCCPRLCYSRRPITRSGQCYQLRVYLCFHRSSIQLGTADISASEGERRGLA